MTVGSFEEDRLAVDQNLGVLELNLTEADFHGDDFAGPSTIFQRSTQRV